MNFDQTYTIDDHEFRDDDMYALAKYRLTLRWLRRHAPGGSLLNVGCGGGLFNQMAFEAGYAVCGLEPDADAFALAKDRAADRHAVENIGLFDATETHAADIVVLHDVLEHIDAEGSAVDALHRLVRPGGVGIISVPALDSLFGYHDRQLGHFRRYTKTSLKRSLSPRFTIEKSRYLGFTGVPVALWYSRIKQVPYPVSTAESGALSAIVRAVCRVEERVPGPIGTSVIAMVSHAR